MNNENRGWIKFHRKIWDHWIWEDFEETKRWASLLIMANYKPTKYRVHNEFYTIKTGQLRTTQTKLATLWGCSRNAVSNFLKLLENDDMIKVTTNRKLGTIIEIKNYEKYQNIEETTISGGWITIHRDIIDHWIFNNSNYFMQWIDLIMLMNYSNQKIKINDEEFEIKVGQHFTSQEKLSKRWNCSRKAVSNFLNYLESDDMIKFKTFYRTGTHIEVLNYKLYQSLKPSNEQRLDNGQTRPEQLPSKSETSAEQSANNGQTTVAHKEEVKNYKKRIKKQRLLDNKNRSHNCAVLNYYNTNFEKPANKKIAEYLNSYQLKFSDKIIIEALEVTLRANKNFNYTIGILENWENENVKTIEDAKKYFNNKKNNKSSISDNVVKEPLPIWAKDDYVAPKEKTANAEEQIKIKERIERLERMRKIKHNLS